ncbi:MAG: primosomal protein N' [Candidatus Dasytiphilus stammeri]
MLIIQVVLPLSIQQYFDYLVPINLKPLIGTRVNVPFGRNRNSIGIIVNIKNNSSIPIQKLKNVNFIIDNRSLFNKELWSLLFWAADYYHYPLGKVLFLSIPLLLRKGQKITPLDSEFLNDQMTTNNTLIFTEIKTTLSLNNEQKIAIQNICNISDNFTAWLLAGITGSGKTEVYLNIISHILVKGHQALILVPEISLIPQTIRRFKERFNIPIEVIHSGLNKNTRLNIWMKVRTGQISIIIGTRSAIFTPFLCLGIIIIDEEHDSSYKQQKGWKYQARDLAVLLAKKMNIPIVMGSATPSLETLYNVKLGKYKILELKQRAAKGQWYTQHLIDLKKTKVLRGLSDFLIKKITWHLQKKNQVLVFLNRRGFSTSIVCKNCGWIAKCNPCDHNFTYHKEYKQLSCHYCNRTNPVPEICEQCGIPNLIKLGIGTEQIESTLKNIFPKIPISRIDRDTINCNKIKIEYHFDEILQGGTRILIGTQMLAKGHHFPKVTLVALLNVDGALFSGDFRSSEKFAQLYTQVAGRVGRGKQYGEVLLQTYYPNHPLLQKLLYQGYESFADEALKERRIVLLPPYTSHVIIRAKDNDNHQAQIFLNQIRDLFNNHTITDTQFMLMGPIPALQSKCDGKYRWQLLLQHPVRRKLQQIIKCNFKKIVKLPIIKKIQWSLDVDPIEN